MLTSYNKTTNQGDKITPKWITHIVIPFFNLFIALLIAGIVIYFNGDDPFNALSLLIKGAFGNDEFFCFTLYYTTNFIFTGLAVSIAFLTNKRIKSPVKPFALEASKAFRT